MKKIREYRIEFGDVMGMFYDDPLEISIDQWKLILTNKEITLDSDLDILRLIYESKNHEASSSEIAARLHKGHYAQINLQISKFSKRVIHKTKVQPPLRKDGTTRWWHVPFLGYDDKATGRFPWIMRPELAIAFESVCTNQIIDVIYPGEIDIQDTYSFVEGSMQPVFVNRYERNREARNVCISHYGSKCAICGFDFEKMYGAIGKDKVHVHHLIPLSEIQKEYKVDPINDLRPVCPNCHLIIHSKKVPFTLDEVRTMISRRTH